MQKAVNDYLEKRGITQSELAKELDVDKGHFSRIVSGKRPASLELLRKLSRKTGKSIDELAKG